MAAPDWRPTAPRASMSRTRTTPAPPTRRPSPSPPPRPRPPSPPAREARENQKAFDFVHPGGFQLPELAMLAKPKPRQSTYDEGALRQNARLLETVLAEFGVKGAIDQIRPGPVVTLYELVPGARREVSPRDRPGRRHRPLHERPLGAG